MCVTEQELRLCWRGEGLAASLALQTPSFLMFCESYFAQDSGQSQNSTTQSVCSVGCSATWISLYLEDYSLWALNNRRGVSRLAETNLLVDWGTCTMFFALQVLGQIHTHGLDVTSRAKSWAVVEV